MCESCVEKSAHKVAECHGVEGELAAAFREFRQHFHELFFPPTGFSHCPLRRDAGQPQPQLAQTLILLVEFFLYFNQLGPQFRTVFPQRLVFELQTSDRFGRGGQLPAKTVQLPQPMSIRRLDRNRHSGARTSARTVPIGTRAPKGTHHESN